MLYKPKLLFLPRSFPYDDNELSFIQTEFNELNEKFDITIISAANLPDGKMIPEFKRYETIDVYNIDYEHMNFGQRFVAGVNCLRYPLVTNEIRKIIRTKNSIPMRLYQTILFYVYAKRFADEVEKNKKIDLGSFDLVYSFWYDVQTFGFMMLQDKYPNIRIISRIHGFDLYKIQRPGNYQPFREFMDERIMRLFFISRNGMKYYEKNFALNNAGFNKYSLRYIGSFGEKTFSPINKTNVFRIVSCSSLISLKRVDLIIKALALIPSNYLVEWNHFGDGERQAELLRLSQKKLYNKRNISYHFNGFVSNSDIHNYYLKSSVDCFINVSSTEGLPVSVQEALAYGIPIIVTDVGGNRELIKQNGILLNSNPKPDEVTDAILSMIRLDTESRGALHKNSMALWERKFNSKTNAEKIVNDIVQLTSSIG